MDKGLLDATAGAQLAMMAALKLLLTPHKGNQQAITTLQTELEALRTALIYSKASEYKREAFEETAQSLVALLAE